MTTAVHPLDKEDPLAHKRAAFHIPANTIYFDGNSLGLMAPSVHERVQQTLRHEWGDDVITSWNKHSWIDLPITVGNKIGRLIGAADGQTICCDSTSINLFKVLCAALQINQGRTEILSTTDNFPTDLYMVQGIEHLLGERCKLRLVSEDSLLNEMNENTAVVLVTEVNFRTGRRLPMAHISQRAKQCGALTVVDLAHSAGALPVDVVANEIDFAVGCTYKYFNAGPGAPAFLYAAERHLKQQRQPLHPLYGWLGHAAPFAFEVNYAPADGIRQFLTGTPPVLSLVAVDAALDLFADVTMSDIRTKSIGLSSYWLECMDKHGLLDVMPCISPVVADERGSQLAFQHAEAYAICQALIAEGVIADFRAPEYLRIGFAPLYNSYAEVESAVSRLAVIMQEKRYLNAEFQQRSKVT